MFLTLDSIGPLDRFDVCIVGTGPAGITCAREIARSGKRVLLLEGGGLDFEDQSQDIYRGVVTGDPYQELDSNRLRFFGGSSNHWGGWSRPLDSWDFEPNAVDSAGWPISKANLDPYLSRACDILDIEPPPANRPFRDSGFDLIEFSYSPPTRFGDKYHDEIEASGNIFLVLEANAFQLIGGSSAISGLVCKDYAGNLHTLRADSYVVAAGGIETPRLLLWSNALANGTLFRSPALGRYFMDHPDFFIGDAILPSDLPEFTADVPAAILATTEQTRREAGTLGCSLRLLRKNYRGTKKLIADLACVAPSLGKSIGRLFEQEIVCGYQIVSVWEQEANENNRITLTDTLDPLGMPIVNLHWRKSEFDKRTARLSAEILGRFAARADLGRVKLLPFMEEGEEFPPDVFCAHHMGATRMGRTPEEGVVDANCKVFGTENLYVASSSVFRSGGYANPTLTIVQLALRLGEHLGVRA